jgi:adenylate cyclase
VAELFVVNGICGGTVFFLPDVPTVLGRSAECHVQIADPWISSMHAMFERRGDSLWVVDLDSRNGTYVDDARIRESAVAPGARLRFGKTMVELRDGQTEKSKDPKGVLQEQGTIVRYLADLQKEVTQGVQAVDAEPQRDTDPGLHRTTRRGAVARRQVAVLNDIGKALIDAPGLDDCLAKILHAVAAAVRAECSSLLLMDEGGRMVARASEPQGSPPRISETVVAAAAQSRAGLLTLDAQQDLRFSGSQSVIAQGIRSCLCVPIWADNRILGMLVLDRGFVDPFTADDLELVTVVGYQAALAIERARFLERATAVEEQRRKLLRHFSPDVANMILSQEQLDKDPLDATVREDVTVLFSDVQGFTGLTERLPPLELAQLLRDYFRAMTEALFEEKGTLDKFIGDGLMAVFGAPVAQPDGAVRAVRCAWKMQQKLAELNRNLAPNRRLTIRIGVNTGRVIAGNFGSPDRLEFTVLGDTVNVASRLESMAEPGAIWVGRGTYERAKQAFSFKSLGAQSVRGKTASVEVFQVAGAIGPAS